MTAAYIKDPESPKRWIIDPEAGEIVRRIFKMKLEGHGAEQIAKALSADKILNPTNYWEQKGIRRSGKKSAKEPHHWNHSAVAAILAAQEYCGDVINFKTYSKSFWLKERFATPEELLAVFRDVHEAVVERSVWEKVQNMRGKTRARRAKNGERNIFSGLLRCSECGKNLHFHLNSKNPEIRFFSCSNYKGNRGTCEATHYIRVDFLEEVLLAEIRRLTKFASSYEDEFARLMMGFSIKASQDELGRKQRELWAKNARIREIDKMIERLFEDNVAGKISDDRFSRMSGNYELEQGSLMEAVKVLESELSKEASVAMSTEDFIKTVRKYTRAKKLTPAMLRELVEFVEVHHPEKVDGQKVQRLGIYFNCVGDIEIPNLKSLSAPEVELQTRKGVALSYSA